MFLKVKENLSAKRLAIRYGKVALFTAISVLLLNANSIADSATLLIALKTALIAGLVAVAEKAKKELKS